VISAGVAVQSSSEALSHLASLHPHAPGQLYYGRATCQRAVRPEIFITPDDCFHYIKPSARGLRVFPSPLPLSSGLQHSTDPTPADWVFLLNFTTLPTGWIPVLADKRPCRLQHPGQGSPSQRQPTKTLRSPPMPQAATGTTTPTRAPTPARELHPPSLSRSSTPSLLSRSTSSSSASSCSSSSGVSPTSSRCSGRLPNGSTATSCALCASGAEPGLVHG